jgi:nucleoside-diphosphate-sugar epimerase
MTKLALTGANGFVARHAIALAKSQGLEVTGVVRSKQAARAAILAGAHPVIVPSLEPEALTKAFAGASAVVHLAQIGSEHGAETYQAVNVGGTRAVIGAARAAGVPRVVYFSGLGVAHYGMTPRCTNPYFLSKLTAELELYRSGLKVVVFRPSFVVGPGGGLIPDLVKQMAQGEVERVGDGSYRMQPIAVRDAAAAILAAAELERAPAVFDLVGPEPIAFQAFLDRVGRLADAAAFRVREVPVAEADRQAQAGGYRGMLPDELDCLLCDEVADERPLEALLGRFLTPLDEALASALRAERAPSKA